jgi:ubiquinone/menaquinone biosynthesis C-methylase UbiE
MAKKIHSSHREMRAFYNTSGQYLDMLATHDESYLPKYAEYVRKFIPPSSKIIDLGCGRGKSTSILSKYYDVIGADISRKFISYAKKKYKAKFVVCNALRLPFKNNTFDAAISYGLIEHVLDVPRCLDEAVRIVRPGGYVIIVAPNLSSPLRPLRLLFTKKGYEGFTSSRFETLLWLFKSIYWSFSKWVFQKPSFIYRKPMLNASGPDADATYISNPYDIKAYLLSKGLKVLRLTPPTFRWNFLPVISPHIGVVAVKKK